MFKHVLEKWNLKNATENTFQKHFLGTFLGFSDFFSEKISILRKIFSDQP